MKKLSHSQLEMLLLIDQDKLRSMGSSHRKFITLKSLKRRGLISVRVTMGSKDIETVWSHLKVVEGECLNCAQKSPLWSQDKDDCAWCAV